MFDLPVETAKERKAYVRFRTFLLEEGFMMLQYSVYSRCYASEEATKPIKRNIRKNLPEWGKVRVFSITDKQFGKMECFAEKKKAARERKAPQLSLF